MVLDQHRRSASQQIPSLQLWHRLPYLPHNVPHVRLLRPQLRLHHLPQGRPHPEDQIALPISANRHAQHCVLWVCCGGEYFVEISPGFVQSGRWCDDAVFHCGFCVFDDEEEGGLGDLHLPRPGGGWGCDCQWGKLWIFFFLKPDLIVFFVGKYLIFMVFLGFFFLGINGLIGGAQLPMVRS